MKVIIFADRDGKELAPLTLKTCVGLLPIVGKPLLEHILDSLVRQQIEEIWLVVSDFADQVEQTLRNGERWGVDIHYVLSRGQELPADIVRRLGEQLQDTEYLILRGDVLRSIRLGKFLTEAMTLTEPVVTAQINNEFSYLAIIRPDPANGLEAANILAWPPADMIIPHCPVVIEGNFAKLDSLANYHQANLDVAQQKFSKLVISSLPMPNHPKLYVGRCSQPPAAHSIGFVANNCYVHPSVVLENAVLNPYVIVEANTLIRNTVILPDTYLGKNLTIDNAIIWGNTLIHIDSGAISYEAATQLRDLSRHPLFEYLEGLFHRSLAVVLLFLSLPLWIIALLVAALENPRQLTRTVTLLNNQTVQLGSGQSQAEKFESWEWATSIPLLRYLPRLFAVIWGKLRLIGISPDLSSAPTIISNFQAAPPPVGLVSPAQLRLTSSPEERYLIEIWYAKRRSFLRDLYWLLNAGWVCFTKRAWVAELDKSS
ncbi:MAG: NDP-sugar synthase [Thiotrichaceae bacterium]